MSPQSVSAGSARVRMAIHYELYDDELLQAAMGLRVFCCFSRERPSLTTAEICNLAGLHEKDVTRLALRLARLRYLDANALSHGVIAWTLMPDEW
jgi:hypothetical protein